MLTERTAATDEAGFKFDAAASGLIFPSSIDVRRSERGEGRKEGGRERARYAIFCVNVCMKGSEGGREGRGMWCAVVVLLRQREGTGCGRGSGPRGYSSSPRLLPRGIHRNAQMRRPPSLARRAASTYTSMSRHQWRRRSGLFLRPLDALTFLSSCFNSNANSDL